ncbi:hypothetical protein [Bowmanella dokdonensis]|uniref:Uncharacterized protein n=1 Tax=Bowmanella dokdonensis TaxID=751969 RepID=A0A939DPY6_9ALTE|nr:hypothetical protein [Bowmanella dokdonensis]MBN7825791.1 hypothetical protein [Bowmanella dokdonensis]
MISSAENHAAILAAHPDLQDQLVVQPYQIELDRVIYFGLSRQSGHAKEIDTIRKKVNQAFNDNAFAKAMQEFAKRHPQYYQVMPPKLEASNR